MRCQTMVNGKWQPIACASCVNTYTANKWLCYCMIPFHTCAKHGHPHLEGDGKSKSSRNKDADETEHLRNKPTTQPGLPGDFDRPKLKGMEKTPSAAMPRCVPQERWIPQEGIDDFISLIQKDNEANLSRDPKRKICQGICERLSQWKKTFHKTT